MNQLEQDLHTLLVAMNQQLEDTGYYCDVPCFNFDDPENKIFLRLGFDSGYFKKLIQIGIKRGFIEKKCLDLGIKLDCKYSLTKSGEKVVLDENSKYEKQSMTIGKLIVNGPAQIGEGNIQNFTNFISAIDAKINEMPVSEAEKKDAKSILLKLTENPLVSSIIGALISAGVK